MKNIENKQNPPVLIDFCRHGACEDEAFLRGKTDSSLSELGLKSLFQAVENQRYDAVVTSPKQRCSAFALAYAQQQGLSCQLESQWQERDFGEWDGLSLATLQKYAPQGLSEYFAQPFSFEVPAAETLVEFSQRIAQAWEILQKDVLTTKHKTLVVTHGGCIRLVLKLILSMADKGLFHLDLPYACRVRVAVYPTDNLPFAKLVGVFPL